MRIVCYRNLGTVVGAAVVTAALVLPVSSAIATEVRWFQGGSQQPPDNTRRFPHHRAAEHHGDVLFGFSLDGLPTRIPGVGTYVGAIGAVRDRGNGNYFAIQGGLDVIDAPVARGAAKIIHVTPEAAKAACREENDVCVIRP